MGAETFVIADAHGRWNLVKGLLAQVGLPREGVTVVQLGDLANGIAASQIDDAVALKLVHDGVIDVMLCGNHEYPFLGGPAFYGYFPHGEIRRSLLTLRDKGALRAAYAAHDVLVTHAGCGSYLVREYGASVPHLCSTINEMWDHNPHHELFSSIGVARGGRSRYGGILWADWSEPKPNSVLQVIGHTAASEIRQRKGALCIDLGAGRQHNYIAGAWIRESGVEAVIHSALGTV